MTGFHLERATFDPFVWRDPAGRVHFPSWFLRITCDRCGKERMLSETHTPHGEMLTRDICNKHTALMQKSGAE
jgi:hypothetical protein